MGSWTAEDVKRHNDRIGAKMPAHVPAAKKSKYRNVRTNIGGEVFDSKREADYWLVLKAREALNEIQYLRRQVPFQLFAPHFPKYPDIAHIDSSIVVCEYVADYVYFEQDRLHVVDAKGLRTREYALKKKWLELQAGIVVEEV